MTMFTKSFLSNDKQAGTVGIWPLGNMGNTLHLGTIAVASPLYNDLRSEEESNKPKYLRLDSTGEQRNDMDFNEAVCGSTETQVVDNINMAASSTVLSDRIQSIVHQLCVGARYQPYSKFQRKRVYKDTSPITTSLTEFCQEFQTKLNIMGTPMQTDTPHIKNLLSVNGRRSGWTKPRTFTSSSEPRTADVTPRQVYTDHGGVPTQSDGNHSDNIMSQPLHNLQNDHTHPCRVNEEPIMKQNIDNQKETCFKAQVMEDISDTTQPDHTSWENAGEGSYDCSHGDDKVPDPTNDPKNNVHAIETDQKEIQVCSSPSNENVSDTRSSLVQQTSQMVDSISSNTSSKDELNRMTEAKIDISNEGTNGLECNPVLEITEYSDNYENTEQSVSIPSDISKLTDSDTTESLLSEVAHRLSVNSLASAGSSVCFDDNDGQDGSFNHEYTNGLVCFQVGSDDDSDSDWSHDSDFDELDGEEAHENDKLWESFQKCDPFSRIPCSNILPRKPKMKKSASSPDILSGGTSPRFSTPRTRSPPPSPDWNYSLPKTLYQNNYERNLDSTPKRSLERTASNNFSAPHLNKIVEKSTSSGESTPKKRVRFADDKKLVSVRNMVAWDFAYKACRKGPWEELARDRCRFDRKIEEISNIISPCLTPEHRRRVYEKFNCTF